MEKTLELYSDADMAELKKKLKTLKLVLLAIAAAGLAVCIALAALTNTANAARMELSAVAVSTVTGWVVIYFVLYGVTARRRELGHAEMLRRDERQRVAGRVTVTGEKLRIVRSIPVRRVTVETEEGAKSLLVIESRAEALSRAGAGAVWTANGYVAAYEAAK